MSKATIESQRSTAEETALMVRLAAARGPYAGTCLPQSLTVWWLLRWRKIDGQIRFGARKEDDKLEAHAWVETGATVFNEGRYTSQSFKVFEPAAGAAETGTR